MYLQELYLITHKTSMKKNARGLAEGSEREKIPVYYIVLETMSMLKRLEAEPFQVDNLNRWQTFQNQLWKWIFTAAPRIHNLKELSMFLERVDSWDKTLFYQYFKEVKGYSPTELKIYKQEAK